MLAFTLVFVAHAPMQHQIIQDADIASEMASAMADMPCHKMTGHASHEPGNDTQDHEQTAFGTCCDGALCAGYTLNTDVLVLAPVLQTLSYLQSPPEALRIADITLPERPPRIL